MTAVHPEAHLLADTLTELIAGADSPPIIATVAVVTAGGASDGNALVQVKRRGTTYKAAGYLNTYTPAVNDRVLCVYVDHQLIVLAKIIGKP